MAEVHQQAQAMTRGVEIVNDLRPVFIRERRHSLQLDQDFLLANEVRDIPLLERPTLVTECDGQRAVNGIPCRPNSISKHS